jgi:MFS family permease
MGGGFLASRRTVKGFGRVIALTVVLFGMGLVAFALSRHVVLSGLALVVTGYGMMVSLAASNTLLQTLVEERMRGRLMSIYAMAFVGTAPFGSLLAGALAARIGAPMTIALGGVVCVGVAGWFYVKLPPPRARVHPESERRGLLPPRVASGLREATRRMETVED